MRILLFTGKGGVGKSTVAAATALRTTEAGLRTLVCSTDPAHSLADVFDDASLGDEPAPIATLGRGTLFGQQLDARARLEESWGEVREYLTALLDWAGAGVVEAEELAVIPGLDEVFALADIRAHAESGVYDVIVVDCAPTAETLRLLSLPDVLTWYMERIFPAQRHVTRAVRPLLSRLVSPPIAGDDVFTAVRRFYDRLDGVRELLTDGEVTSARLVVNAERLVVSEARRTFTYLSLFGYHVDAVVANKLLPDGIEDPWFARWKAAHAEHLATIERGFAPVPVLRVPLQPTEQVGLAALRHFADALYDDEDPTARFGTREPLAVRRQDDRLLLELKLPFTAHDDLEVGRTGDELLVRVGPYRRSLVLPDALRRRMVDGAELREGTLTVTFGGRAARDVAVGATAARA